VCGVRVSSPGAPRAQHSTAQHSTAQHSTAQHSTAPPTRRTRDPPHTQVNTEDYDGWTALHVACYYGAAQLVDELIQHRAQVRGRVLPGAAAEGAVRVRGRRCCGGDLCRAGRREVDASHM
jgi:hypothetical protein